MTTFSIEQLAGANPKIERNYGKLTHEFNITPGVHPIACGLTVTIRKRITTDSGGEVARFAVIMDDDEMMAVFYVEDDAVKAAEYVARDGNLDQFYADDRDSKGFPAL